MYLTIKASECPEFNEIFAFLKERKFDFKYNSDGTDESIYIEYPDGYHMFMLGQLYQSDKIIKINSI